MSYRKRPYRDKKDEVLAESEKLRKDIENLENALALHSRYQVEDKDSIRGLIRQEISGSRWEYGAEGKLTTFRSTQDLCSESSGQQRLSSARQSGREKTKQNSSRATDKAKKSEKEKGHDKRKTVRSAYVSGYNENAYMEDQSFHALEPSIENIAKLINDANDTSNASVPPQTDGDNKGKASASHRIKPNDLTAIELDRLKSKVLKKASVNVIQRNPALTLSMKNTRDLSKEDANKKDLDKGFSQYKDSTSSSKTIREDDSSAHQSANTSASRKYLSIINVRENREKVRNLKDSCKSVHTGLRHAREQTLQQLSSARKDKSSDSRSVQTGNKLAPGKGNSEHHQSLLLDSHRGDTTQIDSEIERSPSRSQSSKSNYLFKLYGESNCTGEDSPQVPSFSSSIYEKITTDLESDIGSKAQSLTVHPSSKLEDKSLDSACSPSHKKENTHHSSLAAPSNHGNSTELLFYQDPVEKTSSAPCNSDVKEWLDSLDLQSTDQYVSMFATHQIDMSSVLLLTPDSLREMGIQALGPIMKIMKGVHILNRGNHPGASHVMNSSKRDQNIDINFSNNHTIFNNDKFGNKLDTLLPQNNFGRMYSTESSSSLQKSENLHHEKANTPPQNFASIGLTSVLNKPEASKLVTGVTLSNLKTANSHREYAKSFTKISEANSSSSPRQVVDNKDSYSPRGPKLRASDNFVNPHSASVIEERLLDTSTSAPICWEVSIEAPSRVNRQERAPMEQNGDMIDGETVDRKDRPSSGRSKRNASAKKKETGWSKVTRKPPASVRIADTGILSASQRAMAKQKKLQERELAKQDSMSQQKMRRDEMAAKHLQRRSSSAERNGESGSSQGLKRPNLHRSSSFTEKRDAQHKSCKLSEHPSPLEGVLTGRGLDTKLATTRSSVCRSASSRQSRPDSVDEIGDILSALQDLPNHADASSLSSRPVHSRSKAKSPSRGLNVTLGAVRKLQTRLSCLEEQLATQTLDNEDEDPARHLGLDSVQGEAPNIHPRKGSKTPFGDRSEFQNLKSTKVDKRERSMTEGKEVRSSHSPEQVLESSQIFVDIKRVKADSEHSTFTNEQEANSEMTSPHSLKEFIGTDTISAPISYNAEAKSSNISTTGQLTTATTVKQGKGHYYGMRKGGFNFQPVSRPPELGVSYHKENYKALELNKEDISFSEDDLCGEGPFSQVFRGTFKGSVVAVKRLKAPLLSKDKNYFKAEISMLRELRHPRVVELLGCCSTDNLPVVMLEFMACGNLYSLLHDQGSYVPSDVEFYQISHDVSSALMYLHGHQPQVLHLDLKPRNVLLSHGNRAKVADFGFSKLKHEADVKASKVSKSRLMHSVPSWMAPELLATREITAKADVYSFGILLWEMFTREIPYAGCTVFQILEQVRLNQRPTVPSDCPPGLARLIQLCWDHNPATRPSFKHILKMVEQLAETDTWPQQTQPVSAANSSQASTQELQELVHSNKKLNSETSTVKHSMSTEKMSEDHQQNSSMDLEVKSKPHKLNSESIFTTEPLPETIFVETDVNSALSPKPAPVAVELKTQAGHTTLFVHTKPQSLPQMSPEQHDLLLQIHENVTTEYSKPSLPLKESPRPKPRSSRNLTTAESKLDSDMSQTRKSLLVEAAVQSGPHKSPRFSSPDFLNVKLTHDSDQTARDLIARYLPPKKPGNSLSKSYEQHSSSDPPKKLLPLRYSLDKLKSKTVENSPSVLGLQDKSTGQQQKSGPDFSKSNAVEINKFEDRESIPMEKSDDHITMKKPQSNAGHLRKSVHPPYADGQPYVPAFYNEIQHASNGKKRAKADHDPSLAVGREKSRPGNFLNQNTITKSRLSQDSGEDYFVAQSAFMRSLNASSSSTGIMRLQEQSAASTDHPPGDLTMKDGAEINDVSNSNSVDNSGNKHDQRMQQGPCEVPNNETNYQADKGGIENLSYKQKESSKDNVRHSKNSSPYFDADFHGREISQSFASLDKNENAACLAENQPLKRLGPDMKIEESHGRDLGRKVSDDLQDLRLDLRSPVVIDRNYGEKDDESVSVFSRSSSSPTPDGISLDSLSLSQDGDTVVDSLEFPDDFLSDDTQESHRKQAPKSSQAKLSPVSATEAKASVKKPIQMEARQSFFLFDDSESSEPFDIIKSVAVQGSGPSETRSARAKRELQQEIRQFQSEETNLNQSLCRSSDARRRARERRIGERIQEEKTFVDKSKTNMMKDNHKKSPALISSSKASNTKDAKPKEKTPASFQSAQPQQPRMSLTGDLLAKGKQLLKPPASRPDELAGGKNYPQVPNQLSIPRFSVDAGLLQVQKGQLRSVQTREPAPLKSVTQSLLPINEDGLPSMANILKKALDERRFAMGDNPESQEYTPEASWSLQDD